MEKVSDAKLSGVGLKAKEISYKPGSMKGGKKA